MDHPRSLDTLVLLGGFVRPRPIAFRVPPETRESEGLLWRGNWKKRHSIATLAINLDYAQMPRLLGFECYRLWLLKNSLF